MAHETADEIERPINSAYFNVVFHEGPIGITFRRDKDREFIYVQNINENTQADNSDIEINDRLWSIHSITDHREFVLGLKHFDTKEFTSLLTYIKEHERPVKLQFRRVLVDEEDNRNGNQLPQHKQELQDDLDEFVLDRHEHEGQSHGIGISGTLDLPLPPRDKPGLKHVDSVLTNDQMLEDVCTQLDMTDYFKYNKIDMDGSDIETILEYIVKPNRTFYRSGFVDIYHAARSANRMSMPPVPPTTPASIFSGFWGSSAPAAPTARQNMPATLYDGLNAIAVSGYNLVAGVTVKRTKMVFLCNDVLIVANEVTSPTTAQHPPSPPKYHVEHMIDISSCKLRKGEYSDGSWLNTILGDSFHDNYIEKLDPHHLKTKVKEPYNTKAIQRVQVLEVISPLGTIVMVFYDIAERDEWFHLMVRSIKCMLRYYHNTDGSDDVVPLPLGWSHQYILGTMSSAIVNHEEHRIRELLQYIDAGIFDQDDILDVVDDEGFSPLLYACILRNTKVIELIHSHCSDVTVPDQLEHVWTPLHW